MTTTNPDDAAVDPGAGSAPAVETLVDPTQEPFIRSHPVGRGACPTCSSTDPRRHVPTVERGLGVCADPWHGPFARGARVGADAAQPLNDEQGARAAACSAARAALIARSPLSVSTLDAIDIVNVANFILNGRDPWAPSVEVRAVARDVAADADSYLATFVAYLNRELARYAAQVDAADARLGNAAFANDQVRAERDRRGAVEMCTALGLVRDQAMRQLEAASAGESMIEPSQVEPTAP